MQHLSLSSDAAVCLSLRQPPAMSHAGWSCLAVDIRMERMRLEALPAS